MVLRPFREKSAGFLMPQGTADLTSDDTIVDISHEALIRHWTKLAGSPSQPGWTQKEANEGQRYRALLELLPGPLPVKTARKAIVWWNSRRPRTSAWTSRYGGRFDEVNSMLLRSIIRYWVTVAAVLGLVILAGAVGLWEYSERVRGNVREQIRENADFYEKGIATLLRDGPAWALLLGLDGLEHSPTRLAPQQITYRALQGLREQYIIEGRRFSTPQVSFSPNSDHLLIAQGRRSIQIVDAHTGGILVEENVPGLEAVTGVKWITSEGATRPLFMGRSGLFRIDRCSQALAKILSDCDQGKIADKTSVTALVKDWVRAVSPNGRYAVSGGWNGQPTYLWDLQATPPVRKELGQAFNAVFNRDSSLLALVLDDHVRVYDTANIASFTDLPAAEELRGFGWRMVALAVGPSEGPAAGKIFTAAMGKARIWDRGSGNSVELPPARSAAFQAVFSPDGTSVAATLDNRQAQIWRWESGKVINLQGHSGIAFSIDFSRDGKSIATGATDGTARVWSFDAALSPQISRISAPTAEDLTRKSSGNRELKYQDGKLSVYATSIQLPIVTLSGASQEWQSYGFVEGGVAAVTGDGWRYFWPFFADSQKLIGLAKEKLPRCGGKAVTLPAAERAILLGLWDGLQDPPKLNEAASAECRLWAR
jgi:WD40 repeat protein